MLTWKVRTNGYGERRMIAYGQMGPHIVAVAFAQRGDRRRIVSARKATKMESRAYLEGIYGKGNKEGKN